MSEEWTKYVKILEKEDREFRSMMWEEVSILFSFELNSN